MMQRDRDMTIREFVTADQAGVNRLQADFMQEFFPEFANDPRQFEWNADIDNIHEAYILQGGKFWVVEADQEIVGMGGFRLARPGVAEIKRVRIKAGCRGRGLGKAIVRMIETYCSEHGISKILVDTDERLAAAKRIYENMGYRAYCRETIFEAGGEYINYYFKKELAT